MLIHNKTTGHSNGELWNLNAEKIFSQSQGLTKQISYRSNLRTKKTLFQRFTLNAQPLNRKKHVVCVQSRFQNIYFIFW